MWAVAYNIVHLYDNRWCKRLFDIILKGFVSYLWINSVHEFWALSPLIPNHQATLGLSELELGLVTSPWPGTEKTGICSVITQQEGGTFYSWIGSWLSPSGKHEKIACQWSRHATKSMSLCQFPEFETTDWSSHAMLFPSCKVTIYNLSSESIEYSKKMWPSPRVRTWRRLATMFQIRISTVLASQLNIQWTV
jgi:hypothetical protein